MNAILNEWMNGDLWTVLGGLSMAGLAAIVMVAVITRGRLHRFWLGACLTGVIAGVAGTMVFAPHPDDVVATTEGVQVLLSPFEGAEGKGVLKSGERARSQASHGQYAYVETEAGAVGWVKKDDVARFVGNWK